MTNHFSLKQALLLSSLKQASLLIEIPGNAIDYKLIATCANEEKEQYTLQIYKVIQGQRVPTSHNNLGFYALEKLIEFVSAHGFNVDCAWIAEEEAPTHD
jgi:hypothetical protein